MKRSAAGRRRSGMKLQQLRCLIAVADSQLNVSAAAKNLHTSQPAVSKQIRLLEQELGIRIFARSGRQLASLTAAGQQMVDRARRIVLEAQRLSDIGVKLRNDRAGALAIGTTHTQARYVLPTVIGQYCRSHSAVQFQLHVGTVEQTAEMARSDRIDFAIATGNAVPFSHWVLLPFYRWYRCVIVPRGHALARCIRLSLSDLAQYPLLTYSFSLSTPPSLLAAFAQDGVTADVTLTAGDADVIKTYVRLGLGVGVVAEMAVDESDADLVRIDAAHLFPEHRTWVGFSRNAVMHRYKYDFIATLAPHLSERVVERAQSCGNQAEVDALFDAGHIPLYRPRSQSQGARISAFRPVQSSADSGECCERLVSGPLPGS